MLIDAMALTEDCRPHHQMIRIVRGIEGVVMMHMRFRPRFDYALTVPRLRLYDASSGLVFGGADALLFQADVRLEKQGQCTADAAFEVAAGDELVFSLRSLPPHEAVASDFDRDEVLGRMEATTRFWSGWSQTCAYEGPHEALVRRSAVVLKALTHQPTGAIVAAPTTSLPEDIGGVRNWDYRYAWLRDSSFVIHAFYALGFETEAKAFVGWLLRTTSGGADNMQVAYGVGGERILPEVDFDHLEGYKGSAPVRIGNGASLQFQLDIYGEMVDTIHLFHKKGGEVDEEIWELCCSIGDFVLEHWSEPDDGIWEARAERRHYVHSKVLCWVALDRLIKLAEGTGFEPQPEWLPVRDEIMQRVLEKGFDSDRGSFVQRFGAEALDAATLRLPLVSFLDADEPRVRSTTDAVADVLSVDGLLRRYRTEDGLPGSEGAFALCSFWLVDNLLMQGRVDAGRELLERLLGHANDLGLLAEEIDPATGESLGNFPQAFSHVALINSVLNLQEAEKEGHCSTCRG
jgi:GH15 family glucan-1,4-alpha-glucosidase